MNKKQIFLMIFLCNFMRCFLWAFDNTNAADGSAVGSKRGRPADATAPGRELEDSAAKLLIPHFKAEAKRQRRDDDTRDAGAAAGAGSTDDVERPMIGPKEDLNKELWVAATAGDPTRVSTLIAAGAKVNVVNFFNSTPLHQAAHNGHAEVVRILIDAGAQVNALNFYDSSPLHQAAENGHVEVVRILIAAGATSDIADKDGCYPFMLAAIYGQIDLLPIFLSNGVSIDSADATGYTALMHAVAEARLSIVDALLKAGANPLVRNRGDMTALDLTSDPTILELLCEPALRRGDIKSLGRGKSFISLRIYRNFVNNFFKAIINGNQAEVDSMLEEGASVNSMDHDFNTPLHQAALNNHVGIVRILIDAGAPLFVKNKDNKMALDLTTDLIIRELLLSAMRAGSVSEDADDVL